MGASYLAPENEDIFLVGSVNASQKVTIYNIGNEDLSPALELVVDDDKYTICCTTAIHPSYDVIAGSSFAGKSSMWRQEQTKFEKVLTFREVKFLKLRLYRCLETFF